MRPSRATVAPEFEQRRARVLQQLVATQEDDKRILKAFYDTFATPSGVVVLEHLMSKFYHATLETESDRTMRSRVAYRDLVAYINDMAEAGRPQEGDDVVPAPQAPGTW